MRRLILCFAKPGIGLAQVFPPNRSGYVPRINTNMWSSAYEVDRIAQNHENRMLFFSSFCAQVCRENNSQNSVLIAFVSLTCLKQFFVVVFFSVTGELH